MQFRIADTFTNSLARLTAQEQRAAKTTAFDLQLNPSSPGLSFHKLDRAQDPNFWSVRVNTDIRLIVHKTDGSLLLAYVAHHDAAYRWAERRKLTVHPTTGAMQLVEVRELVEELPPRQLVASPAAAVQTTKLFDNLRKFELMAFGVPPDWIDDVREATEDTIFDVLEHLPQEAQEALLRLAVGERPPAPAAASESLVGRTPETPILMAYREIGADVAASPTDGFEHPDAMRRFRQIANAEELRLALEYPWEKWAIFLHPMQRELITRRYSGPARVSGSAGTGKTIVALHRAAHLARVNPQSRVLLTTFSKPLANHLRRQLTVLVDDPDISSRITVAAIATIGYDLFSKTFGQPEIASAALIRSLLSKAAAEGEVGNRFSERMLLEEWKDVVDAWQLDNWEAYRDVARLGRKTRIGAKQREVLWSVFSKVKEELGSRKIVTWSQVFGRITDSLNSQQERPFDHAVIEEAQDVGVAEARFLSALAGGRPDGLFFAGDLGQRIFQQPFSWRSMGIDVRGRSSILRVNYRTSHQIRTQADRLLPSVIADVDGLEEGRRGTVSMFDGPAPEIMISLSTRDEELLVGNWISTRLAEGLQPDEIAVIVRSNAEVGRARAAMKSAGLIHTELTDKVEVTAGSVAVATMHLAKGLEFRAVVVMACDDGILPSEERIANVADDADLEEVYNTERHLLYVACTRARDHLLVSGVKPASEFLTDLAAVS